MPQIKLRQLGKAIAQDIATHVSIEFDPDTKQDQFRTLQKDHRRPAPRPGAGHLAPSPPNTRTMDPLPNA